jgi:quaternary ammonium compound-resistance protein SugE
MAWVYLFIAGVLECTWAIGMKQSQGFTRLWPSVWTIVLMIASFVLLSIAMNRLPAGTAYAVWTGIGAAGTALLGILILKEPASAARLACIGLIVAGVIGLKLVSGSNGDKATPASGDDATAAVEPAEGEMTDAPR